MPDWGPFPSPAPRDPVRWTLHKDARHATCRIEPHALGFEVIVEVDHDVRLTQVHRQEGDADIHAATLEDQFIVKGWS